MAYCARYQPTNMQWCSEDEDGYPEDTTSVDIDGSPLNDCSDAIVRAKSDWGGFGAFAVIAIEAETELGVYNGRLVERQEGDMWVCDRKLSANGEYSLTVGDNVIDASSDDFINSLGRNINHSFFANSYFDEDGKIVTTTNVEPGEEITVDYGDSYNYRGFERIDVDWEGALHDRVSPADFFRAKGASNSVLEKRYLSLRLHVLSSDDTLKRKKLDSMWKALNKI